VRQVPQEKPETYQDSRPLVLPQLPEYGRGFSMPFVKCSVDGCSRKLQPVLKVDPRDRDTWLYRECDVCLKPACEKHSAEVGVGSSVTAAEGRPKPNGGQRGLSTSVCGCTVNRN